MNTVSGRLGNWAAGLPSVCGWTKLLERAVERVRERERVMYEKKVYADYVDCRCTRKLPRKREDSPRKDKAWYVSCLKHGIWAMVIPALLEILLLAMGYGIQLLTTAPFMQVLRGRAHHQRWKVASRADRGQMGQQSKLITHHEWRLVKLKGNQWILVGLNWPNSGSLALFALWTRYPHCDRRPLVTRSTWISSELALRCDRMWWTQ